ncbi:MAG: SUMF1/EgtB/PvdO family nonheme iron enzyme [Kiritimatiellae bacterium]|nr:SUMF1/EgtB/PvdO family nonheme iron enzyme [Kiritimatiellia bacterium]
MTYDTISDAATMQAGAEGTLLAGRYRIVRQLGQGGMGSVWLAEDTQLDNKQFAIKMLPSILVSNKRAYRQLKDEALVAMKLTHPNIVNLRAFEENNGNPFLVMDYIEGQTLDDYLAEVGNGEEGTGNGRAASTRPPSGGLPEDEVIRLLKPIAAALDYAHSKGVVHRDVKPGNVMIAKDGTSYILDFGIAREIQETMTRVTGKLSSGTLLYMSPEQLNGDMPKPAQDVYSFAAMVYECLKGEPPFSRGNIEFQIMNKMPAPLDPHFAKSGSVMQGLEKKPEDRPKTCAGVLEGNASPRGGARTRRVENNRASAYAEATVVKEHVGRTEGNNFSHKGHKDRKEVGRGVPTAPHGMSSSTRSQNQNIAGIALPIFCIVVALLVLGGGLWYRGQQRKQAEWRRIVAAQKAEETARQRAADERKSQEEAARRKAEAERRAQEEADRRKAEAERKAQKEAKEKLLAAERREKAIATEARAGAKAQQARVERISDADGFKERKVKLADDFAYAEKFYSEGTGLWKDATALYEKYIEQGKDLVSLDEKRRRAVERRESAIQAFKNADAAGAKAFAATAWNAAVKMWDGAVAEFGRMEFATASELFMKAKEGFDVSANEATRKKNTIKAMPPRHGDVRKLTLPGGAIMEMIYCAPGEFMMGSNNGKHYEQPVHNVRLTRGFWLGKYEVTQKQWQSVMGDNCPISGGGDIPVGHVWWDECIEFTKRINARLDCGARLPTEAEWEYACRAGTVGDYAGNLADMAWYSGNSSDQMHAVGSKNPNPWGFYDMHGNVEEWCADKYDPKFYYNSPIEDPINTDTSKPFHVLRGGSYGNLAKWCRSSSRSGGLGGNQRPTSIGFRLCCSDESNAELNAPRHGGAAQRCEQVDILLKELEGR